MDGVKNCTTCYDSLICYKYHKSRYDKYHDTEKLLSETFDCPYYEEEPLDDED